MVTLVTILTGVRAEILALNDELGAELTSDWDRFTHVYGRGNQALEQLLRDRVFTVIPTSGPTSVGCVETVTLGVGVVYLDKEESADRMLAEVPLLRARLRTLSSRVAGVTRSRATGPVYAYDTIVGVCVVTFALDVEYCCEGG